MAIDIRQRLILYAYQFRGTPYIYGGDSPALGCDCSELVRRVLQKFDLLPSGDYWSQSLFDHFKASRVLKLSPGNLIFFGPSTEAIEHVAIAIDGEKMIEAGGGGSRTKTLAAALAANACVRVENINRRRDRVAICDPFKLKRE